MCQRKVISKDLTERIVPLLQGCDCPMIKEFRHLDTSIIMPTDSPSVEVPIKKKRVYSLPNHCFDIHTEIRDPNVHDHHVGFRNCVCSHPSGLCMVLPPLLNFYTSDEELDLAGLDDDDDEDQDHDGSVGIRSRMP